MMYSRGNAVEKIKERYCEIVESAKNYRHMTIQTTFHFDEVPTIRYDITEVIIPDDDVCENTEVTE